MQYIELWQKPHVSSLISFQVCCSHYLISVLYYQILVWFLFATICRQTKAVPDTSFLKQAKQKKGCNVRTFNKTSRELTYLAFSLSTLPQQQSGLVCFGILHHNQRTLANQCCIRSFVGCWIKFVNTNVCMIRIFDGATALAFSVTLIRSTTNMNTILPMR